MLKKIGLNYMSKKGYKHSEETRRKLREARKRNAVKGVIYGMVGKHHSLESRKKMSKSRKGIPHTEEWKKNFSENHFTKKEGYVSPLKGRPFSEEHKRKIGLATSRRTFEKKSPNPLYLEKRSPYRYAKLIVRLLSPKLKCFSCNKIFELGKLHIHHTDIFNRQPETVDMKTLKVLCFKCHRQADMEIWRKYKETEVIE
jgi:hypothetical protein